MDIFELVKNVGLAGALVWFMWYQTTKTSAVVQRNTEVMSQVLTYLAILQSKPIQMEKETQKEVA